MKFQYSWLKELTGSTFSAVDAAERLTMLGLEVESCTPAHATFQGVVVGEVLAASPIEGSRHLKLCQVSIGREKLQIVCGAPNVEPGQRVPVATEGAILPGGIQIKKTKLRGVLSEGMICSDAELGLSDDASGIKVLNGEYTIGQPFTPAAGNDDHIIELSITPNRPDCLGMHGIARELSISDGRAFAPELQRLPASAGYDEKYPIELQDPDGCPRYTARIIRNISIGPSPRWLAERLQAAGVRSINNVVDITNYIMLKTGQPLHAFDLDLLKHGKIVVRTARKGERMTTLDGKMRELQPGHLLICDGDVPVALAGIMGGEDSEVQTHTKNILLEAAYFDPASIRKTAKQLGLSSESAKRFERGVDPNGCDLASDAATALLVELAGGKISSPLLDAYPVPIQRTMVPFRPTRARRIIGAEISDETMQAIFARLECRIQREAKQATWQVAAPTFRPDLTREIDLIEEIARVYGYPNIQAKLDDTIHLYKAPRPDIRLPERLRHLAMKAGLSEIQTLSLVSEQQALPFLREGMEPERLLNPISAELAYLRPSLLCSMLGSVLHNQNRKQHDLRFFEMGHIFTRQGKKLIEQHAFAGVITGAREPQTWERAAAAATFFDLKGIVERILAEISDKEPVFIPESPAQFSFAAGIRIDGKDAGIIGALHKSVLDAFQIEREVFAFELHIESLLGSAREERRYTPFSPYPSVDRDIAILLDIDTPAMAVQETIRRAGGTLLQRSQLFDLYQGKQVPDGQKSMAFALSFQSPDRTLRDEEVDEKVGNILKALKKEFGATLRQ